MIKSLFFPLLLIITVFFGCGEDSKTRIAKGNINYGGIFRCSETEPYISLYPHRVTDIISMHIGNQVYEGLLKFNPKLLVVEPCIAENYEVDESGRVYTFKIKKGVKFHDDECFDNGKGRELTAQDFVYCFKLLCTPSPLNRGFSGTFENNVVGANEYYYATPEDRANMDIPGLGAVDDYTLKIELIRPNSSFVYGLARISTAVFPKEAVDRYGERIKIGTGPFFVASDYEMKGEVTKKPLLLLRNNNYHRYDTLGNQLPYIDSLEIYFINSSVKQLEKFEKGKLDMIYGLPTEKIKEVVEININDFMGKNPKYILYRTPEMRNQYYEFNLTNSVFRDVRIRKAFCYAIDRSKLVQDILKGQGFGPGINGITPPSFPKYNVYDIVGYQFDPEKAKAFLSDAGYENGVNFPKIKLVVNSGGSRNIKVAHEIQRQLKNNLNIDLNVEIVPFSQKLEQAKYAKSDLVRGSWIADYPSPENFLWLLYGKGVPETLEKPSWPNSARYVNEEYDSLYELGVSARTVEESYEYFKQAEKIMIEDAPILVLWYDENYQLVKGNIKNMFINPLNYRDFSEVYFTKKDNSIPQ